MSNLAEILAMPIIGNAMSDQELFNEIHEFVMDPANAMADKIQAIVKLDQAMGETNPVTEQDVLNYIEVES